MSFVSFDEDDESFISDDALLAPLTQHALRRHNQQGTGGDPYHTLSNAQLSPVEDAEDEERLDESIVDFPVQFSGGEEHEVEVNESIATDAATFYAKQQQRQQQVQNATVIASAVPLTRPTASSLAASKPLPARSPSSQSVPPPSRLQQPQFFYAKPPPNGAVRSSSPPSSDLPLDTQSDSDPKDWKSRPTVLWGGSPTNANRVAAKKATATNSYAAVNAAQTKQTRQQSIRRPESQASVQSAPPAPSTAKSAAVNPASDAAKMDARLKFLQQQNAAAEESRAAKLRATSANRPMAQTKRPSPSASPPPQAQQAAQQPVTTKPAEVFAPSKVTRITTVPVITLTQDIPSMSSTTRSAASSVGSTIRPFVSSQVHQPQRQEQPTPQVTFASKPVILNSTGTSTKPAASPTGSPTAPDGSSYSNAFASASRKPSVSKKKKKKKIPIISAMEMTDFNVPSTNGEEQQQLVPAPAVTKQKSRDKSTIAAPSAPAPDPIATSVDPIPPSQFAPAVAHPGAYPIYSPYGQHPPMHGQMNGANGPNQPHFPPQYPHPFFHHPMHGLPPHGGGPGAPPAFLPSGHPAQPPPHGWPPPPHMLPYGAPPPGQFGMHPHGSHPPPFHQFHGGPPPSGGFPPQHMHVPPPSMQGVNAPATSHLNRSHSLNTNSNGSASVKSLHSPSRANLPQPAGPSLPRRSSMPHGQGIHITPPAPVPSVEPQFDFHTHGHQRGKSHPTQVNHRAAPHPMAQSIHTIQEQSLLASLDRLDARLNAVVAPSQSPVPAIHHPPPVKRLKSQTRR